MDTKLSERNNKPEERRRRYDDANREHIGRNIHHSENGTSLPLTSQPIRARILYLKFYPVLVSVSLSLNPPSSSSLYSSFLLCLLLFLRFTQSGRRTDAPWTTPSLPHTLHSNQTIPSIKCFWQVFWCELGENECPANCTPIFIVFQRRQLRQRASWKYSSRWSLWSFML